jgi:hypothetical protein
MKMTRGGCITQLHIQSDMHDKKIHNQEHKNKKTIHII